MSEFGDKRKPFCKLFNHYVGRCSTRRLDSDELSCDLYSLCLLHLL